MSFLEDIAAALDREGIESRVHDDTMFVPITPEIEIQFVVIDEQLPAANVYIAAADVDEDDEDFEAALVAVIFSAEDAVSAVAEHIATDEVVTVFRSLLEAADERIAGLEFFPDAENHQLVFAEVGTEAEVHVEVEVIDATATAHVQCVVPGDDEEADPEELNLGSFTDIDRLFDVLNLVADQAEDWEGQMLPLDDEPGQ